MKRADRVLALFLCAAVGIAAAGTFVRNRVYRNELTLWRDCAEKNNWQDMRTMVAYVGALKKEGRDAEASEILEQARKLDWNTARFSIENIKFLVNQYIDFFPIDIRIVLHEFLLDLDPDDHRSYEFIASAYMLKGDMENARITVSLLNRVFVYEEARALMGDIYSHYGCFSKAEREYMKAVTLEPNNPLWRLKLLQNAIQFRSRAEVSGMLVQYQQYLPAESVRIFGMYLQKGIPEQQDLLLPVAGLCYLGGEYARAEKCLNLLIAESGSLDTVEAAGFHIQAAGIFSDMREYARVYSILSNLEFEGLSDIRKVDVSLMMGRICGETGRYRESAEWYDRALEYIDDPEIIYVVKRKRTAAAEGGFHAE